MSTEAAKTDYPETFVIMRVDGAPGMERGRH